MDEHATVLQVVLDPIRHRLAFSLRRGEDIAHRVVEEPTTDGTPGPLLSSPSEDLRPSLLKRDDSPDPQGRKAEKIHRTPRLRPTEEAVAYLVMEFNDLESHHRFLVLAISRSMTRFPLRRQAIWKSGLVYSIMHSFCAICFASPIFA